MTIVEHDGTEHPDPSPGDAVNSSRGYLDHSFARMRRDFERPRGGWFAWGVAACGVVIDHVRRNEETGTAVPFRRAKSPCPRCARIERVPA